MLKLIKSSFYREKYTKKKLLNFIKKANIFSMGKECRKFEDVFAKKQKRKHAVFVNSGSSANLILIQSLLNLDILKKKDKVGISALTWSTNIMPIIQLGLCPVVIDCEINTLNISPETLNKHIKNLKGIFLTNVLGFSDKIEKIKEICATNNVLLIEDNCEALGSKVNGKLLGNFGLASTFSFFVGHHLSTIEGGMVCTDNEELANMLIMVRAHGWDRHLFKKNKFRFRKLYNVSKFYSKYTFYDLSYNVRPTEINGFLGNSQINYWDEIVGKRSENFKKFYSTIQNNHHFIPLNIDHMSLISNFAVPIICKNKNIFKKYKNLFEKSNVEIRPIIAGNITKQPFYKKYISKYTRKYKCDNADFIHQNGFYFCNNPELTSKEVRGLCNLLKNND